MTEVPNIRFALATDYETEEVYTTEAVLSGKIPPGFLDVDFLKVENGRLRYLCEDGRFRYWPYREGGKEEGTTRMNWPEFVDESEQYMVDHGIDPEKLMVNPTNFIEVVDEFWENATDTDVQDRFISMGSGVRAMGPVEREKFLDDLLGDPEIKALLKKRLEVN